MEKSMHFNPFPYIRSKSDITKLVTNLIQNTNSANIKNSSQDPFWEKAERMFLESLLRVDIGDGSCNMEAEEIRQQRSCKRSVLCYIRYHSGVYGDWPAGA